MGSSAKKKREKKQDFQKTKLKVGKAKPKSSNATDTSFVAKSITLKDQSLSENAPDQAQRFRLHLSLLSSKNTAQRRDALAYLAHSISSITSAAETQSRDLPASAGAILARAQPLVMDESAAVRQNTLKLLRTIPAEQLGEADLKRCFLLTTAGMTHMAEGVRRDSLDMLSWILQVRGNTLVAMQGHWMKGLRTWQSLLSWHGRKNSDGARSAGGGGRISHVGSWTSLKPTSSKAPTSSGGSNSSHKLLVAQLSALVQFLETGLRLPLQDESIAAGIDASDFACSHTDAHLLGARSSPYVSLCLFGPPADADAAAYESAEARAEVFETSGLRAEFEAGVQDARKEAGEVGRAAWGVEKAMRLHTQKRGA